MPCHDPTCQCRNNTPSNILVQVSDNLLTGSTLTESPQAGGGGGGHAPHWIPLSLDLTTSSYGPHQVYSSSCTTGDTVPTAVTRPTAVQPKHQLFLTPLRCQHDQTNPLFGGDFCCWKWTCSSTSAAYEEGDDT
jgi:hypothetical protein